MAASNIGRLDRTKFSVIRMEDKDRVDREYWLSKTPYERMVAVETIRQMLYGYDPATARIQRVLEIVKRT